MRRCMQSVSAVTTVQLCHKALGGGSRGCRGWCKAAGCRGGAEAGQPEGRILCCSMVSWPRRHVVASPLLLSSAATKVEGWGPGRPLATRLPRLSTCLRDPLPVQNVPLLTDVCRHICLLEVLQLLLLCMHLLLPVS